MSEDVEGEAQDDLMDMQPPPVASRAMRAAPRRMMTRGGTQSLPAGAFAFAGAAPTAAPPLPAQTLVRPAAGGVPPPGGEPDFDDLFNQDF